MVIYKHQRVFLYSLPQTLLCASLSVVNLTVRNFVLGLGLSFISTESWASNLHPLFQEILSYPGITISGLAVYLLLETNTESSQRATQYWTTIYQTILTKHTEVITERNAPNKHYI